MAQESNIGSEAMQYAKDMAKAEKELKIEPYVSISLCYKDEQGNEVKAKTYTLSRESLNRWLWVINWRRAKLICENPRRTIYTTYYYFDKNSGLDYSFRSDLSRLASLKGRITQQERAIESYIASKSRDLFFDQETDEQLIKIRAKLQRAKENMQAATERMIKKVEQLKSQS